MYARTGRFRKGKDMHGIVLGRWTEESKERRREGSQETEVDSRGH